MKKLTFSTILLSIALTTSPGFAAGETVHVKTLGLVCDFCAQSIEKTFMKTGKTEKVDVDLDKALVTLVMKDGQHFTDEVIKKTIGDAGYTVEGIHHMGGVGHE